MKSLCMLAAAAFLSGAARADENPAALESATPSFAPAPAGFAQYDGDEGRYRRGRRLAAREGLLISFGLGGGSLWDSSLGGRERLGAFDFDFRLGYGFSDRFQIFMDFGADAGTHPNGVDLASWTFTLRGQTVLIGDRAGNGLNVNFGAGLGGMTYNGYYNGPAYYGGPYAQNSSPTGLALAGGVSYDARVTPWFSFSPEFFITWHEIPDGYSDVASVYGLRVNFLWYLK
jgi:hypothetical protein